LASEYFRSRWQPGTLVTLGMPEWRRPQRKIVGIVCALDEVTYPLNGGGSETVNRVFVKWFHEQYPKVAAYSSPEACLEIVSEVDLTNDK